MNRPDIATVGLALLRAPQLPPAVPGWPSVLDKPLSPDRPNDLAALIAGGRCLATQPAISATALTAPLDRIQAAWDQRSYAPGASEAPPVTD